MSLNSINVGALDSQAYTLLGNALNVTYGITTAFGGNSYIFNTNVTTCRTEDNGNITINSGIIYESGCNQFINYDFSGSDSQLKITSFNVAANETIPIVFNVIPKQNIQNSITGRTDIINPVTNQSIAQSQAQTELKPIEIPAVLVRTGGEILWIGLGLITIIGAIAFGPRIVKGFRIDLKE